MNYKLHQDSCFHPASSYPFVAQDGDVCVSIISIISAFPETSGVGTPQNQAKCSIVESLFGGGLMFLRFRRDPRGVAIGVHPRVSPHSISADPPPLNGFLVPRPPFLPVFPEWQTSHRRPVTSQTRFLGCQDCMFMSAEETTKAASDPESAAGDATRRHFMGQPFKPSPNPLPHCLRFEHLDLVFFPGFEPQILFAAIKNTSIVSEALFGTPSKKSAPSGFFLICSTSKTSLKKITPQGPIAKSKIRRKTDYQNLSAAKQFHILVNS